MADNDIDNEGSSIIQHITVDMELKIMNPNTTANTEGSLHAEDGVSHELDEASKKRENTEGTLLSVSPILLTQSGEINSALESCLSEGDVDKCVNNFSKASPVPNEFTEEINIMKMASEEVPQCNVGVSLDNMNGYFAANGEAAPMQCDAETIYLHPQIISVQDKEGNIIENCILDRDEGSCSEKHKSPSGDILCSDNKKEEQSGSNCPLLLHVTQNKKDYECKIGCTGPLNQVSHACCDRQGSCPDSGSQTDTFSSSTSSPDQNHILSNSVDEHHTTTTDDLREPQSLNTNSDNNKQAVSETLSLCPNAEVCCQSTLGDDCRNVNNSQSVRVTPEISDLGESDTLCDNSASSSGTKNNQPVSSGELLNAGSSSSATSTAPSHNLSASLTTNSHSITSGLPINADSPQVLVKFEPQDTGYDFAIRGNSQTIPCTNIASAANSAKTSVIWRGKKRVRVTVIKGEWRRPKTKSRVNTNGNNTAAKNTFINRVDGTANSRNTSSAAVSSRLPDAGLGVLVKTEPQEEPTLAVNTLKSVSTEALCSSGPVLKTESLSSAVPIALFRNAHIKLERISDDSHFTQPGTSSSRQPENIPTSSRATFCGFSKGAGCGTRGRQGGRPSGRPPPASVTELSETQGREEDPEKIEIRPCAVQLRPLPSDVLATGMVNLKSNPKILHDAAMFTTSVRLHKLPLDVKRPWVCSQCGKSYKTKSARTQHFKVHNGIREHICSICGADFMYKSVLTTHYRFVHGGEKPHVCPDCGKAFAWSSHLRSHINRHYEEKSHTCTICHKNFSSHYMKKHMAAHSDYRPFNCQICGASFKSKRAIEIHERVHTGYRPFTCDKCGRQFPYSSSLLVHKRTHTGERPYSCKLCPSTFTQSTHLRTHMRGVHKASSLPPTKRRLTVKRMLTDGDTDPAVLKKDGVNIMRMAMGKVSKKQTSQRPCR